MSFANRYLPYFRQCLITNLLLALSHFQSLFTESSCGDQFLAPSPFSGVLREPCSLCCVFFISSLFIIQLGILFLFSGCGGGSICPGDYAFLSQGWLWEYHVLFICSPVDLLNVSQVGLE
jgi:hypothetical protein